MNLYPRGPYIVFDKFDRIGAPVNPTLIGKSQMNLDEVSVTKYLHAFYCKDICTFDFHEDEGYQEMKDKLAAEFENTLKELEGRESKPEII
jgi:hypothetical protein